MKTIKIPGASILTIALSVILLTGCTAETTYDLEPFSLSNGLEDTGYWQGVTALDHVTLPDSLSVTVPGPVHEVSPAQVQAEIDGIMAYYAVETEILDRPVLDGDTLRIDYTGTLDGLPFEGGSTGGQGTLVTLGTTSYIDGFLDQLIGRSPGETFDITVTFPEDYGDPQLQGKEATFAITLHGIIEDEVPELNDDFVTENLTEFYGFTSKEDMTLTIERALRESAITDHVLGTLLSEVAFDSVPRELVTYQEKAMIHDYEDYAGYYGITLDEFLMTHMGMTSQEELIEATAETNRLSAEYYLFLQAVAEKQSITVSEEALSAYFSENMGTSDYSGHEALYGKPYLKLVVLQETVLDHLVDLARLAD